MTALYIASGLMGVVMSIYILRWYAFSKSKERVKLLLETVLDGTTCSLEASNGPYDFELHCESRTYLVKTLLLSSHSEVVINHKTVWQINKKGHDRGQFDSGMARFMAYPSEAKKIVITHPAPYNMLLVLNESDMTIVDSTTNVHGANIFTSDQIDDLKAYLIRT